MEVSKFHPARSMPFDFLYKGLMAEVEAGNVNMSKDPTGELELFDYSLQCQFAGNWNVFTLMSRGLILCPGQKKIVSMCLPKFLNIQELEFWTPNESFTTTEKVDGSCLFLFFWKNEWHCSTRGSFVSDQAKWALAWAKNNIKLDGLNPNLTYICEVIYPENRVVVKYDWSGLVLLTAFDLLTGEEQDYQNLSSSLKDFGFRFLKQYDFSYTDEIVSLCEKSPTDEDGLYALSSNEEGFVVKFKNGLRMKIKGKQYLLAHKAKNSLSPLSAWESAMLCQDMTETMKLLPDEFFQEWSNLVEVFNKKFANKMKEIKEDHLATLDMTDKELGMSSHPQKNFIFAARKNNLLTEAYKPGKCRSSVFNTFRPKANILEK
jgi:RNA ligase